MICLDVLHSTRRCSYCKKSKFKRCFVRRTTGVYESRCKRCSNKLRQLKYAASPVMKARHAVIAAAWQKANLGSHRQSSSLWEKRNRVARVAAMHRYRARRAGNGGAYTVSEWEQLKRQCNYSCLCCGAKEPVVRLTADHVIPIVFGGSSNITNIQPLCKSCNSVKNAKTIDYRGNHDCAAAPRKA